MRAGGTVYEGTPDVENLVQWIKNNGDFGDWAILCSTNREIEWLMDKLEDDYEVPTITFKQGKMTKKQLETETYVTRSTGKIIGF